SLCPSSLRNQPALHRHLRSTPTRRSSDLLTATSAPLTVTAEPQTITYGDPVPTLTADYSGFVLGDGPEDLSGALSCTTTATDARSEETRLNSSHVKISYAVFCLKKKKEPT